MYIVHRFIVYRKDTTKYTMYDLHIVLYIYI